MCDKLLENLFNTFHTLDCETLNNRKPRDYTLEAVYGLI
jgi:hypothetical protein